MTEHNFAELREKMIQTQLVPRGITDKRVLEAFRRVPRHLFVGEKQVHLAYRDHPLPIGEEQTISQPYIVALMTQSLLLKGGERVLEVGTGSGYQTAILAELAAHVYSVERISSLSARAQEVLVPLGYDNISFKVDDGSKGWAEEGPFDAILVAAAAAAFPSALAAQLKEGGRLVIPVGGGLHQDLNLYIKEPDSLQRQSLGGCRFVPLIED